VPVRYTVCLIAITRGSVTDVRMNSMTGRNDSYGWCSSTSCFDSAAKMSLRPARAEVELLQQELHRRLGYAFGDLEADRIAEVPVQQLALHRDAQVLDLLLVH